MLHYFVVILIIAIIVIIQFRSFANTKQKIRRFLWIFPEKKSDKYELAKEKLIKKINSANENDLDAMLKTAGLNTNLYHYTETDAEGNSVPRFHRGKAQKDLVKSLASNNTTGIYANHDNDILKTIVSSINDYLKNNKSGSDFHLMKDIVDRSCDAKEEEISTQIPVPLYLGLVGTMAGILIGTFYLWLSGGIGGLLSAEGGTGKDGIEALLGGIALAMISSILGIILTTLSSSQFKNAKSFVDENKHSFLSWIQAKLLPTLSDNVASAIKEMAGNLTAFNKEFSDNTSNLGDALAKVNESYKLQTHLLDAVHKIADKNLAHQNLELYNVLKSNTAEIGTLAEYLQNCNQYLANVKELNNKLDDYETRTGFIKKASDFYSKHDHWLAENYDEANRKLKEVVGAYNDTIQTVFHAIKGDIESKRQELGTFIDHQNAALKTSAGDLDKIVKALSELGEVQKAVKAFESAIKGQNAKIDHLTVHIERLANAKSSGGAIQIEPKTSKWQIGLISIIAISCIVLTVNSFIKKADKTKPIPSESFIPQPLAPPIADSVTTVIDSAK